MMYIPGGEAVADPGECPAGTCPFSCGPGVCPDEYAYSQDLWCEPCEEVEAYREGDGSGCVWSWANDVLVAYCGDSK